MSELTKKTKEKKDNNKDMNKKVNAKKRLIRAAHYLFSELGYDATTTRMIADRAQTVQSAISFHFGSKEGLCAEVVEYVKSHISKVFDPICDEISQADAAGTLNEENALEYIDKLVRLHLDVAFNPKGRNDVYMVLKEDSFPSALQGTISKFLYEKIESKYALLLSIYCNENNPFWAAVITRNIVGGILTFSENQPMFQILISSCDETDPYEKTKSYLYEYIMNSLKALKV